MADGTPLDVPALFGLAEVSAALSACDALLPHADDLVAGRIPALITLRARFVPCSRTAGPVAARSRLIDEPAEAVARLRRSRKTAVEVEGDVMSATGHTAAHALVTLQIRLVDQSRLRRLVTGG